MNYALTVAIATALIAASAAVLGVYLTQFVAENFRRFRDGSALAASLHGELRAHMTHYDLFVKQLEDWAAYSRSGKKDQLVFRLTKESQDLIFDNAVPRLGLLGVGLVEQTVLVYSEIKSLRSGALLIQTDFKDMSTTEFEGSCDLVRKGLVSLKALVDDLLPKLHERANRKFSWLPDQQS